MNGLDGDNAMSDVNVSNPSMNAEALVRHEVSGRVGCITLNRPKALNAHHVKRKRIQGLGSI